MKWNLCNQQYHQHQWLMLVVVESFSDHRQQNTKHRRRESKRFNLVLFKIFPSIQHNNTWIPLPIQFRSYSHCFSRSCLWVLSWHTVMSPTTESLFSSLARGESSSLAPFTIPEAPLRFVLHFLHSLSVSTLKWASTFVLSCLLQMWEDLIWKAKHGGLDVIDTYVFWDVHEPSPGNVLLWIFLSFHQSTSL